MTSAYQTKQHNELLSLLKEHQNESLKANDILMLLKNLGVSISLATVYRQLEKLISKGLVIKDPGKGGPCCSYFVYKGQNGERTEPFYLKCELCGKFTQIECSELKHLKQHILTHHGFCLTSKRTVLMGLCEKCEQKIENKDK